MSARCVLVHPLAPEADRRCGLAFTLEQYRDFSLDRLASSERADPRFWWQRRNP